MLEYVRESGERRCKDKNKWRLVVAIPVREILRNGQQIEKDR